MRPVPREAFQEISGFEAKKHAIRQTTDGLWQLTLTVHEFGAADWLVFAPTGLPLAIGLKAMDYDNPEIGEDESPRKKYVQRAVMLCKDEQFQKYMEGLSQEDGFYNWGTDASELECSTALREYLGITSRADLAAPENEGVRVMMDTLVKNFRSYLNQRRG